MWTLRTGSINICSPPTITRVINLCWQKGGSYGDIYGVTLMRDSENRIVLNEDGTPASTIVSVTSVRARPHTGYSSYDALLGRQFQQPGIGYLFPGQCGECAEPLCTKQLPRNRLETIELLYGPATGKPGSQGHPHGHANCIGQPTMPIYKASSFTAMVKRSPSNYCPPTPGNTKTKQTACTAMKYTVCWGNDAELPSISVPCYGGNADVAGPQIVVISPPTSVMAGQPLWIKARLLDNRSDECLTRHPLLPQHGQPASGNSKP